MFQEFGDIFFKDYTNILWRKKSKKALKAIPEIELKKCFDDWKKRWHKCIISGGDYFEGDEINLYK